MVRSVRSLPLGRDLTVGKSGRPSKFSVRRGSISSVVAPPVGVVDEGYLSARSFSRDLKSSTVGSSGDVKGT